MSFDTDGFAQAMIALFILILLLGAILGVGLFIGIPYVYHHLHWY